MEVELDVMSRAGLLQGGATPSRLTLVKCHNLSVYEGSGVLEGVKFLHILYIAFTLYESYIIVLDCLYYYFTILYVIYRYRLFFFFSLPAPYGVLYASVM